MKSERIITSNRGRHTYKLTLTGFVEFGRNVLQYNIDRHNIALAFAGTSEVDVCVGCARYDGIKSIKCGTSVDTNGRLSIGCRDFNKATTRLLLKWFDL